MFPIHPIQLQIIGVILIAIALMHFGLPKKFDWNSDLPKLTGFNRHMFLVQCFFIALNSFLMGVICLGWPQALIAKSQLGMLVSAWLLIYWGCRFFCQFFVYPAELWKGKRFETAIHVLFSCVWTYFVYVFGAILISQLS